MFSVFFAEQPVTDFATAKASQTWRFRAFFHALLDAGCLPALQRLRGLVRLGCAQRRGVRTDRRGTAAAARAAATTGEPKP